MGLLFEGLFSENEGASHSFFLALEQEGEEFCVRL